MANSPEVSVIFPIYNNEKYVEKCVRSVMNQTLKDIELILIDDGSTGRTPQICDDLASEDARIKVVHKKNEGSAAGRNQGIDLAQGEYVAFVESDDYVAADMYQKLYEMAWKTSADIVKCGFYYCEEDFKYEARFFYSIAESGEVFRPADKPRIFSCHASIWAGIYKRSFINENRLRFIETPSATYSDFSWMAMTLAYAKRVTIFHEPFYYYKYDNPDSSWNQEGEKCLYKPFHCLQANRILREAGIFDAVKEEIGVSEYRTCQGHARRIKKELRDDYFNKYREVMLDLTDGGFAYKRFSSFNKLIAKLVVNNRERSFYSIMKFYVLRKKLYSEFERIPFVKSLEIKYKQRKAQ